MSTCLNNEQIFGKKLLYEGKKMVENHKLLGLDCEGEKRIQNHLERREKELIGFLKREFNVGYQVVEAKWYHKKSKWLGGQNSLK